MNTLTIIEKLPPIQTRSRSLKKLWTKKIGMYCERDNLYSIYRILSNNRICSAFSYQIVSRYREVFAQDRSSDAIADPYLMLIPAHDNTDIFKIVKETPAEEKLPRVFSVPKELRKSPGDPCIVDQREFERNFDIFTEAQFRWMNWNNVFAAGVRLKRSNIQWMI